MHQRGDETLRRIEAVKAPPALAASLAADAQNLCALPRGERHVERIERQREPLTRSLDEGFFARPAVQKTHWPLACGQGVVGAAFVRRKAVGEVISIIDDTQTFHVDAHLNTRREGVHGKVFGMSEVESNVS